MIEQHQRELGEIMAEIEEAAQMIELKMRAEKKTKFVQYYPDMVKQTDRVLNFVNQRDIIGDVDSTSANIEQPVFDYRVVTLEEFEDY